MVSKQRMAVHSAAAASPACNSSPLESVCAFLPGHAQPPSPARRQARKTAGRRTTWVCINLFSCPKILSSIYGTLAGSLSATAPKCAAAMAKTLRSRRHALTVKPQHAPRASKQLMGGRTRTTTARGRSYAPHQAVRAPLQPPEAQSGPGGHAGCWSHDAESTSQVGCTCPDTGSCSPPVPLICRQTPPQYLEPEHQVIHSRNRLVCIPRPTITRVTTPCT
mmetsp:Transcript_15207/g.37885  ORF Transcript_15207/g.37885 Transcript_15207/m.37885 type:complete len:221 (+) Transcript_15207:1865-2527(+)